MDLYLLAGNMRFQFGRNAIQNIMLMSQSLQMYYYHLVVEQTYLLRKTHRQGLTYSK